MSNSEKNQKKLLQLELFLKGKMNDEEKERFFEMLLEEPRLFRLLKSNALILKAAKKEASTEDEKPCSNTQDEEPKSGNVDEPVEGVEKTDEPVYAAGKTLPPAEEADNTSTPTPWLANAPVPEAYVTNLSDQENAEREESEPRIVQSRNVTYRVPKTNIAGQLTENNSEVAGDSQTTSENTRSRRSEEHSGTRTVLHALPRRHIAALVALTAAATILLILNFGFFRNQETELPWVTDQIDLVNLAVPDVVRSLDNSGTDYSAVFSEATLFALTGETDQAKLLYQKLAETTSFQPTANYNLGILHFNKGNFTNSTEYFSLASCSYLDNDSIMEACFWFKALSHLQTGETISALAEAKNTLQLRGVYMEQAAALTTYLQSQ